MIGGTYVSWDLVAQVIQDQELDRLEVCAGPRSQRIIEANDAEGIPAAIAYVREHVEGTVTVSAWKAAERKTSGYVWQVKGGNGEAIGAASGGGNVALFERLYEAKYDMAVMQHTMDNDGADKYERIAGLIETLAPQLIAALTGRKAPVPVATIAAAAPMVGTIGEIEMADILADVVAFARVKPEQARQYVAALRSQIPAEDEDDNDNSEA